MNVSDLRGGLPRTFNALTTDAECQRVMANRILGPIKLFGVKAAVEGRRPPPPVMVVDVSRAVKTTH